MVSGQGFIFAQGALRQRPRSRQCRWRARRRAAGSVPISSLISPLVLNLLKVYEAYFITPFPVRSRGHRRFLNQTYSSCAGARPRKRASAARRWQRRRTSCPSWTRWPKCATPGGCSGRCRRSRRAGSRRVVTSPRGRPPRSAPVPGRRRSGAGAPSLRRTRSAARSRGGRRRGGP